MKRGVRPQSNTPEGVLSGWALERFTVPPTWLLSEDVAQREEACNVLSVREEPHKKKKRAVCRSMAHPSLRSLVKGPQGPEPQILSTKRAVVSQTEEARNNQFS